MMLPETVAGMQRSVLRLPRERQLRIAMPKNGTN
jgi:hypothetical protein